MLSVGKVNCKKKYIKIDQNSNVDVYFKICRIVDLRPWMTGEGF